MAFENRSAAGRQLAATLAKYKDENPVILALPRGGVPVAAEIAVALAAPLDLILVRKLGVPFQPELAMGAVVDGIAPRVVRNRQVIREIGINERDFERVCTRELAEIERRRKLYLGNRPRVVVEGSTAIVVDDGVATGATARVALEAVRALRPRRLILAVPVASADELQALRREADEVVCIEEHRWFGGVSQYYADFEQVSDEDVIAILSASPVAKAGAAQSTLTSQPSGAGDR